MWYNINMYDRYYSSVDIWAIAFGCMIGWGVFVMPGTTFLPVAGPIGTLVAMTISVIIMLIIAVNYFYLMRERPTTGGVYAYTKEAFGRDHAFLCSWFLTLSYMTIVFLNATALFVVVRTLFGGRLQGTVNYEIAGVDIYLGEVMVSVLALLIVGVMFIVAKSVLQHVHTVLSIILFLGVLLITVTCAPHISFGNIAGAFGTGQLSPAYGIFSIVLLAPWAFVGFDVISLESAHFRFPMKRTKWILIVSIIMAGFAYSAMAIVSIAAVPDGFSSWSGYFSNLNEMQGVMSVPTFHSAVTILGNKGLIIIGISALAAILTGLIGAYRAAIRMLSTMAEDKILSEKFNKTSTSIIFIMIISVLISFLGGNALNWFVELTSLGAVIGFGYTSASAFKMARRYGNRQVMITGAVGTVITVAFAAVQLIPKLTALEAMGAPAFLLLALWCMLGFLFYWRTVRNAPLTEYNGITVSGIALFVLLLYSVFMWFGKRIIELGNNPVIDEFILHNGIIAIAIIFIGLAVMLYVQNLTRKKHENIAIEKMQIEERNLAKSQFLFNMSHDIRTPMNAIVGYTNLAMREDASPKIKEFLEKINFSNQQMLGMIDDLLEMSRIESGMVEHVDEPIDIHKEADSLEHLFSEQMMQKQIDFSVDTTEVRNPYVFCDRRNLNRVLMNIVSNAYKFTPEGGTISVKVDEVDDGVYDFHVKDSGIGMSEEFKEKMFTAFERERSSTDSGVQGTGLGLAIVKNLTELMGGEIDVITAPGEGTEFIIHMKFDKADKADIEEGASEEKADTPPGADYDFSGKRLLVAEDNEINREIVTMLLETAGFELETAENGQVAIDKVVGNGPGYFDAILMDIQMPVMDGYTATRNIRALENRKLATIPIIALTANAFSEDEVAAEKAGMQGHISKPIEVDVLMNTLAEVFEGTNIK